MPNGNEYGRWINQLSHQIKRRMDARLANMGITGVQGRILHYITDHCRENHVFQKDIEEAFRLRRSTATGILQLLEKNELIRREPVPYDARLKSLIPTDKTGAIQEEMRACIRETEVMLIQNIDSEDLLIFQKVIRQMADNLGS